MKAILIVTLLLGAAAAASAQGTVIFANTSATLVSTNGVPTGGAIGPTTGCCVGMYYYALMVAPTNQTTVSQTLSGWTFTGNYATNIAAPGRFRGGTATVAVVPGYGSGQAANFLVVGWSSNIGHDWSTVYPIITSGYWISGSPANPGYVGMSGVATNVVLGGSGTPTPLFGFPPLLAGFTLYQLCLQPPYFYWMFPPLTNETVALGGMARFYVGADACPGPAACLWFFNGSLIARADWLASARPPSTSVSEYQITNVRPANAGQYFAVFYDPQWEQCCGAYQTSSVAVLTVLAPGITPAAQTAEAGATVGFRARAYGFQAYDWYLNSTQAMGHGDGAGALWLTNAQPAQAGNYTLVLTASGSHATNGPAALSVIPPVPRTLVPAVSLSGTIGGPVTVESATAISPSTTWLPLGTVDFTNLPQWYFDLSAPAERFYRAWRPASFGTAPTLSLVYAPALTLTGAMGSTVRVDYINQLGPTGAWATLSTVNLTNSSQIYVDTSAIGQPPRLWRFVPGP